MSSIAKTLWIATIALICGSGLFLVHKEDAALRQNRFGLPLPELSTPVIEAEIRAVCPEFVAARKIEAGLSRTMNSASIQLSVVDLAGRHYTCSAIRSTQGWKIEQVRRLPTRPHGRLI